MDFLGGHTSNTSNGVTLLGLTQVRKNLGKNSQQSLKEETLGLT